MYGSAAIDSAKLFLPLNQCSLNEDLYKVVEVNYLTGEELRVKEAYYNEKTENGISCSFRATKLFGEKMLDITINSKMLKGAYFQGIRPSTLNDVYQYVNSFDGLSIPYESFMSSRISDVDIFQDSNICPQEEINSFLGQFNDLSRELGHNQYNLIKGQGFELMTRKTGKASKPFLKIYHKGHELLTRSSNFYNSYLKGQDVTNLVRMEATFKNQEALRLLSNNEIKSSHLKNVIEGNFQAMLTNAFGKHYKDYQPKIVSLNRKQMSDFSPTDLGYIASIEDYYLQGRGLLDIQSHLTKYINCPKALKRMCARIEELFNFVKGMKKEQEPIKTLHKAI